MLTIPELLELAKTRNGFKSDRQLGKALGRSNLAPYRTKGEIPNDLTAMKLADLCGLPPHEVVINCHLLKAAQSEHPSAQDLWQGVLKMVSNACIVLAALGFMALKPAASEAGIQGQSFTQSTNNISIMRHCVFAVVALLMFTLI